jgi:diacylglycerol O-acyltransferase / wax synthase
MTTTALSTLDSAFLFFERPTQPLHVGCVTELDGPLDFASLTAHFRDRIGALGRFRQRPVRSLLDLRAPTWEDDPSFAIPHHVHRLVLPEPGGQAELHAAVDRLFSAPLSLDRPPWEVYSIEGLADGRAALLWKVHHCMIDGVSGAQLIHATTDAAAPETREGSESAARPRPARPKARSASPEWHLADLARALVETVSTVSSMALSPVSSLPFLGPLGSGRRLVWSRFPLSDLLAIRGAADCKVNDVVLAIVAGALRRYLEQRGVAKEDLIVRAVVPVSVRGEGDRLALGNLVTGTFPQLPIGIRDPAERLHAVAREMADLKRRGQPRATGFALAAGGVLPVPFQALLGRVVSDRAVFSTVVTNVPGPPDVRTLMGRRVEAIHPMVPLFQGMGLEFAVMSYGGQISIAATADAELVPDPEHIADALVESEQELRDAVVAPHDRVAARPAPLVGPRIRDLMSTAVATVGPEDSLLDAYRLMRARAIRHLPVVNACGRLVGIVTHRDLLAAAKSSLEAESEGARLRKLGVAEVCEVMEIHLSTVGPDEPAADAGRRIVRHKIGCLPVVDEVGSLLGIVTVTDYVRWAADHLEGREMVRAAAG